MTPTPTTTNAAAEAEAFFRQVFGDRAAGFLAVNYVKPAAGRAGKPPLYTDWFRASEPAKAAARAAELSGTHEVWFGAGLYANPLPRGQRGGVADVVSIPGLWADVDFKHPVHKKADALPPGAAAALGLVGEVPVPPTLVVHTGHGLHAYWLFKSPWTFACDADRAAAQRLANRLKWTLQRLARARGWKVDAVADLARVLRVVGTADLKDPAAPAPVRLIHRADENRFEPADLELLLDGGPTEDAKAAKPKQDNGASGADLNDRSLID